MQRDGLVLLGKVRAGGSQATGSADVHQRIGTFDFHPDVAQQVADSGHAGVGAGVAHAGVFSY